GGTSGEAADDGETTGASRPSSPRGWVVAAAVATMLAVGTGGYIAGSQSADSPVMTESADVSVRQDSAPQEGAPQEEAETDPMDSLTDDEGRAAGAQPQVVAPVIGPVEFIDDGLPSDTSEAEAWVLDPDTGDAE